MQVFLGRVSGVFSTAAEVGEDDGWEWAAVGCGKFGFYFEWEGDTLELAEQRSDII